MNRFSLLISIFLSSTAAAQSIPIDRIWSNGIKGMRSIRDLDPANYQDEYKVNFFPTIGEIGKGIIREPSELMPPCFVVRGSGTQALIAARDIFTKKSKPESTFKASDELSLIFFSDLTGTYLQLDSVSCDKNVVKVDYHHVMHGTMESKWYVAIIPLGRLSKGEWRVNIHRLPTTNTKGEKTASPILNPEQIVCGGASFDIQAE